MMMVYVLFADIKGDVIIRVFHEREQAQKAGCQIWKDLFEGDDEHDGKISIGIYHREVE